MTRTTMYWKSVGEVLAVGASTVALYVAVLAVIFGQMAHEVARII